MLTDNGYKLNITGTANASNLTTFMIYYKNGKFMNVPAEDVKHAYCIGIAKGIEYAFADVEIKQITDSNNVVYSDFTLNVTKKETI